MTPFVEILHSGRVLLMDGAMGTELQRAGLGETENGTAWTLLHPDQVRAVHRNYLAAGAEVHLTNTFLVNAVSLVEPFQNAGLLPIKHNELWQTAYQLIEAGPEGVYRLASIGPIAGRMADREFDQWGWLHISFLLFEQADAILLETCSSPRVRFVLQSMKEHCDRPLLLSLAFTNNAGVLRTFSGHRPEWFARRARRYGVAALGVNCGRDIGMKEIVEIIRRYRQETDLPLFARPNAGTPTKSGRSWVYPHTPAEMAAQLPELLEAGVAMIGGCCGTTPAHIAAFRTVIDTWNRGKGAPERAKQP
jgi:methionine synthase I (cobalamin-dependent)